MPALDATALLIQLNNQLDISSKNEHALQLKLNELCSSSKLQSPTTRLNEGEIFKKLGNDAKGIELIIEKTFKASSMLSEQVRRLDQNQSRISSLLNHLESINELLRQNKILTEMLNSGSKDLVQYCDIVKRCSEFDLQFIKQIYSQTNALTESGGKLADANRDEFEFEFELIRSCPVKEFEVLKQRVLDLLIDEFDVAQGNQIYVLFKMFPLVGMNELGLDKYSGNICSLISSGSVKALQYAVQQNNTVILINHTRKLFEDISLLIDKETTMVEEHYGPGSMLHIITRLKREADVQLTNVLSKFISILGLDLKVKQIQEGSTTKSNTKAEPKPEIDSRELDYILEQLSLLCDLANLFSRFFETRVKEASAKSGLEAPSISNIRRQNENLQGIINYFVVLGDYFVKQSIKKAFSLDKVQEGELTTSVADDVFYIITRCLQHGLATRDPDCFCALTNSIANSLELDYMVKLQDRLSEVFTMEKDNLFQLIAPTLNNIDFSCESIVSLCNDIESVLRESFSTCTDMEIEQIKASLSTMTDYADKYKSILRTWLQNYFKQSIKPRLRGTILMLMADEKYNLTEAEYQTLMTTEQISKNLFKQFKKIITPIENAMTDGNKDVLVTFTLESLLKELETKLYTFKFNAFGASVFDLQLRNMIALFLDYKSRLYFTRLVQISMVLNFENIEEYQEVLQDGFKFTITKSEIVKCMGTRIEFDAKEVAKLAI